MINRITSTLLFFGLICNFCFGQNVPIISFSLNNFGQAQLEIEASSDKYYVLSALHLPGMTYESVTSITLGVDGNMFITEPLAGYGEQNYKITEHSIANPDDIDGDGIDDITELNSMPTNAPLNHADAIAFEDGTTSIDNAETFAELSVMEDVPWAPFLNGQQFVKFGILDRDTDNPKVYFINSKTHFIHADFFLEIGALVSGDDGSGEIVYNPNEILPNGAIGSYSFNFSFGEAMSFEATQRTFELLAANMPFLKNNLQHFIGSGGEEIYQSLYKNDFIGSRINVTLESEVFADIDFIPFHQAEGFGYFRSMSLDENPGSRDIVLYDALPNSLPRVGGIITSVVQTPLSHVNLRAIQDDVPNAYIKDPLLIDSISSLLNNYIYYKVEQDKYEIREATLEEVNDWFEKLRPTEDQIPDRDLTRTEILPLDEIEFTMGDAFGAKCSNVATMRTFGFPEGTIPDGFGIPFYFYDEFMKFNGFYDQVEEMISQPDFITDLEVRIERLKDFRKEIKDADMPQWMLDELQEMHDQFPEGQPVRCRSSTNNEDLPGFSGAGLYTSKTQRPEEGHISKSVKQVYASMWNFRAYEERDFYRVDHYIAAMGILCHPNYDEEKSNGVGISIDPIYSTDNTFYLNTQVGEFLITNPDANSIPEEILLNEDTAEGYFVLRNSNLVPVGELVMGEEYLDQLRGYLRVIHDEFAELYNVVGAEGFGMDIEYKVTKDDLLIIKQARPWVSFWAGIKSNFDLAVDEIEHPSSSASLGDSELAKVKIANEGLRIMQDFEISFYVSEQLVETIEINDALEPFSTNEYELTVPYDFSEIGDYDLMAIVSHNSDGYSNNDTLRTTIRKLRLLEGGLTAELKEVGCGEELFINAQISNYGETTFTNTEVEVNVNGTVVETVNYNFGIPFGAVVEFPIIVTENLMALDNDIVLNLVRVNGVPDEIPDNNTSIIEASLSTDFDFVRLEINTDNFPQETTWQLFDDTNGELVGGGSSDFNFDGINEEICINYTSCYTLFVFDSYGDGICCAYGMGDFSVFSNTGELLVFDDGDFGSEAQHSFCPGDGCSLSATIATIIASEETAEDGVIAITATGGEGPYEYSIDGGETFGESSFFPELLAGIYMVVIKDASGDCIYEETVVLEFDVIDNVEEASLANLKLYPNPTSGLLQIVHNDTSLKFDKIKVMNSLGQRLSLSKEFKIADRTIDISHLNAGVYYIILETENSEYRVTKRIVKVD